jgi:tRNA threonylcarbamoyladenosine biosynthesis protein TsaE
MTKIEFRAQGVEDLLPIAKKIIDATSGINIYAFYGKMGAGKTTLIKSFCKALNVIDEVNSPTFSIVNEYFTEEEDSIYHFDFYRIKKVEEVFDIGYEEYIYNDNYCFLEWPELIVELLPPNYVYVSIEELETGERIISFNINKQE